MFFVDSLMIRENYFSGIAYSKDSIVLSTGGLEKFCNDNNHIKDLQGGRYSLMYTDTLEQETQIMTDPTGQDIVFYYQKNKYWAVSNSLLLLVEKLQEKDERLTIYYPGLLSFQIKHSLGEQPLSNNTLVDGIKILPRDCCILIQKDFFSINKRNYSLPFIANEAVYIEELSRIIWDQISVINDLSIQVSKESIRCDVSGGLDSRLVFGMAYRSNARHNIKYSSNKRRSTDYLIASSLLAYYSMDLNNAPISGVDNSIDTAHQLALYKYGNAGIYTKIYPTLSDRAPQTLHIHGAGGENLRGQYVGSPKQVIGRLRTHFTDAGQYDLVKNEFLGYFDGNTLDIDDSRSMLHHSRNFMARFHFGRNWYRFLTNPMFTPLCDIRLENLSDFLQGKYSNSISIFYDSYMILDKILAFFPFDENQKNLDVNKLSSIHVLFSHKLKSHDVVIRKVYGELRADNIVDVAIKDTQKDLTFEELLQKEKESFVIKYPQLSNGFDWAPNVYTLLNSLNSLNSLNN